MGSQVVIFGLGEEEYGMPIEVVREITRLGDVRHIPQAPAYVKGLINIRGLAIPLIDLHIRFDGDFGREIAVQDGETTVAENEFALITEVEGSLVGFAVDQVKEVRVLENIVPPPPLVSASFIGGIVNLSDRIILHLIPEKILKLDELKELKQLQ